MSADVSATFCINSKQEIRGGKRRWKTRWKFILACVIWDIPDVFRQRLCICTNLRKIGIKSTQWTMKKKKKVFIFHLIKDKGEGDEGDEKGSKEEMLLLTCFLHFPTPPLVILSYLIRLAHYKETKWKSLEIFRVFFIFLFVVESLAKIIISFAFQLFYKLQFSNSRRQKLRNNMKWHGNGKLRKIKFSFSWQWKNFHFRN